MRATDKRDQLKRMYEIF